MISSAVNFVGQNDHFFPKSQCIWKIISYQFQSTNFKHRKLFNHFSCIYFQSIILSTTRFYSNFQRLKTDHFDNQFTLILQSCNVQLFKYALKSYVQPLLLAVHSALLLEPVFLPSSCATDATVATTVIY